RLPAKQCQFANSAGSLLKHKARQKRAETGDKRWKGLMDEHDQTMIPAIGRSIYRPIQLLTLEPINLKILPYHGLHVYPDAHPSQQFSVLHSKVGDDRTIYLRVNNLPTHSLDESHHRQCYIWYWPRVTNSKTILVYSGIFTFLVDAYPSYAASALAANSFARSAFGGVFPLFEVQSNYLLQVSRVSPMLFHSTDLLQCTID
ncbi:MFS general substrate transporter, partial [Penicillium manginii]|uniref:MFS general substrate transporter n=1 Tax=Penicillium manginii TaxID=203109 RepID=UPI002546FDAD